MRFFIFIMMGSLLLWGFEPIVTAKWLNQHENDKNIRIVEVSDGDTYNVEHIPHSTHTSISKWRFDNGTFLSIRNIKDIENEISSLGINSNTNVVLYAPIKDQKDLLKASYIYWALNYHGINNVAILDGGMQAWKDDGLLLAHEKPEITSTNYKAKIDASKIAKLDYVKSKLKKLPMIDARPSDMYLGITPTAGVERNGHISGAMSYSWNYSVDKNYKLKDKLSLESLFKDGYRLDKNKEVIVYCTGGLETSFNYYVLSGILGYKKIRLYDASMKEWGNRNDTPMKKYRYEMF